MSAGQTFLRSYDTVTRPETGPGWADGRLRRPETPVPSAGQTNRDPEPPDQRIDAQVRRRPSLLPVCFQLPGAAVCNVARLVRDALLSSHRTHCAVGNVPNESSTNNRTHTKIGTQARTPTRLI
eukprot:2668152-Prymnesium_polylepis.1